MSARQELLGIKKQYGRLAPELIWPWARSHPKSKLHNLYNWNVAQAAEAHWLERSREILRTYQITIKVAHRSVSVNLFVRDPNCKPDEQGYKTILEIREDPVASRKLMEQEFKMAEDHMARAKAIALVVGHRKESQ